CSSAAVRREWAPQPQSIIFFISYPVGQGPDWDRPQVPPPAPENRRPIFASDPPFQGQRFPGTWQAAAQPAAEDSCSPWGSFRQPIKHSKSTLGKREHSALCSCWRRIVFWDYNPGRLGPVTYAAPRAGSIMAGRLNKL